jgi:hypothetical protein
VQQYLLNKKQSDVVWKPEYTLSLDIVFDTHEVAQKTTAHHYYLHHHSILFQMYLPEILLLSTGITSIQNNTFYRIFLSGNL